MNWQDRLDLAPNEAVLWQGRPVVRWAAVGYLPLVVLGLPWCGVACLLWTDPGGPRTTGDCVMSGILALLGLLAVTAPLQAWFLASRTTYVLTNLRAVVLEPGLLKRCKLESFPVGEWKLEVLGDSKGAGSVCFASFGMGGRLGFKNLADISVVEPLVRRLAAESAAGRLDFTRRVKLLTAQHPGWQRCLPGETSGPTSPGLESASTESGSDTSTPTQIPADLGVVEAFRPRAELFHTWGPVAVGAWIVLVVFGLGTLLLGAQLGSLWMGPVGIVVMIACAVVLGGSRIRRRRQLKCPACERRLLGAVESHCPHCGEQSLVPPDPCSLKPGWRCGGCGRRIHWGDGRDFLLHHCTHCGVLLHRKGLKV